MNLEVCVIDFFGCEAVVLRLVCGGTNLEGHSLFRVLKLRTSRPVRSP